MSTSFPTTNSRSFRSLKGLSTILQSPLFDVTTPPTDSLAIDTKLFEDFSDIVSSNRLSPTSASLQAGDRKSWGLLPRSRSKSNLRKSYSGERLVANTGRDVDTVNLHQQRAFEEEANKSLDAYFDLIVTHDQTLEFSCRSAVTTTITRMHKDIPLPAGHYFFYFLNEDYKSSIYMNIVLKCNNTEIWKSEGRCVRVLPRMSYMFAIVHNQNFTAHFCMNLKGSFVKGAAFELNVYRKAPAVSPGIIIQDVEDNNPNIATVADKSSSPDKHKKTVSCDLLSDDQVIDDNALYVRDDWVIY